MAVTVPLHMDRWAYAPEYATEGAAGLDLFASESTGLMPGQSKLISCGGVHVVIPEGYELQVRSRSGLAAKHGVIVLNAPGTIDSDYRGEVKVILHNAGFEPYIIKPGDRIAQMVLAKVETVEWELVREKEALGKTDRGEGGFGSTGT